MNALYLILIAICFTARIWATSSPDTKQTAVTPCTEQLKNKETENTKAQEHHEPCSTEWKLKKLLAK